MGREGLGRGKLGHSRHLPAHLGGQGGEDVYRGKRLG